MKIALVAGLVILAGCAGPVQRQRTIAEATTEETCEAYYFGPAEVTKRAEAEAARRGLDCTLWKEQAAALHARRTQPQQPDPANDAQRAAMLQYLMSRPPVQMPQVQMYQMPIPQTTTCRSMWMGGTLQTTCN